MAGLVLNHTTAAPLLAGPARLPPQQNRSNARLLRCAAAPSAAFSSPRPSRSQLRAATAQCIFEESEIPTPDVPSPSMMADFLVMYGRTLKHFSASGETAATLGSNVLERVRVGVVSLLSTQHSVEWQSCEQELEGCLVELQKDLDLLQRYRGQRPAKAAVQMASLRCIEAAKLLQRL